VLFQTWCPHFGRHGAAEDFHQYQRLVDRSRRQSAETVPRFAQTLRRAAERYPGAAFARTAVPRLARAHRAARRASPAAFPRTAEGLRAAAVGLRGDPDAVPARARHTSVI